MLDQYSRIPEILQEKFIFSEQPAKILNLALSSRKNCVLYGDAGHGKSEMVTAAIDGLGLSDKCFVQSFGEGMDEARLWGGLDFRALEEEKVLNFAPHRSFLNYEIAVFEELFDAPAIVLQSLKDTLTAREMRNGEQRFKMKTRCIIALTNRHPSEISELGAAAHALVERFPLQLEVKWDSYKKDDFADLFAKVKPRVDSDIRDNLAEVIAEAHENGSFISPRAAIHAIEAVTTTEPADYTALAFVPGFEGALEGIKERIAAAEKRREAIEFMSLITGDATEIIKRIEVETHPIQLLKLAKKINNMDAELDQVAVPDDCVEARNTLRRTLQDAADGAKHKALEVTYE